jgi:hypothetical protein
VGVKIYVIVAASSNKMAMCKTLVGLNAGSLAALLGDDKLLSLMGVISPMPWTPTSIHFMLLLIVRTAKKFSSTRSASYKVAFVLSAPVKKLRQEI